MKICVLLAWNIILYSHASSKPHVHDRHMNECMIHKIRFGIHAWCMVYIRVTKAFYIVGHCLSTKVFTGKLSATGVGDHRVG